MKPLSLTLLLFASACSQIHDTPADPSLAHVSIFYVEMEARDIARSAEGRATARANWTPLAYSQLDRANRFCLVVLPPAASTPPAYLERLRIHEVRHCHGEQHPERARFTDDFTFASAER